MRSKWKLTTAEANESLLGRFAATFTMPHKRVLNLHEEGTHVRLREAVDAYGAHVFAKVRVADVLTIEGSGIDDRLYRFALQSHFDFVVTDKSHEPLFAVEFDGPTHHDADQITRDKMKNELCERFGLPLLRVNARYINKKYRDMDMLTWFVHVWFGKKWFDEAQRNGEIAYDEPFMPQGFVSVPGRKNQFPLWLSARVREKIRKLFFEGKVIDFCPSHIIGLGKDGNYHALAFIAIDSTCGVYVQTGMKAQQFPVSEVWALDELAAHDLWNVLEETLQDKTKAHPIGEIQRVIDEFSAQHAMRQAFTVGEGPLKYTWRAPS